MWEVNGKWGNRNSMIFVCILIIHLDQIEITLVEVVMVTSELHLSKGYTQYTAYIFMYMEI